MIRKTLDRVRDATFSVCIPDIKNHDFPTAGGTGFFVSPDGYAITAAHVVEIYDASGGATKSARLDIEKARFQSEQGPDGRGRARGRDRALGGGA